MKNNSQSVHINFRCPAEVYAKLEKRFNEVRKRVKGVTLTWVIVRSIEKACAKSI